MSSSQDADWENLLELRVQRRATLSDLLGQRRLFLASYHPETKSRALGHKRGGLPGNTCRRGSWEGKLRPAQGTGPGDAAVPGS